MRRFLAALGIASAACLATELARWHGDSLPLVLGELFCLFAALSAACACWLSQAWRTSLPQNFALGFLVTAVLNALQICLTLGLRELPATSPLSYLPGSLEHVLATYLLLAAVCDRFRAVLCRRRLLQGSLLIAGLLCVAGLAPIGPAAFGYLLAALGVVAVSTLFGVLRSQLQDTLAADQLPLLLTAGLMVLSQLAHSSELLFGLPYGLGHFLHLASYSWLLETVMLGVIVWPRQRMSTGLRRATSLLNALPCAVATVDAEGVVRFVNDALAGLCRLPAESFAGLTLRENLDRLRTSGCKVHLEAAGQQSRTSQVVTIQHPQGSAQHWYAEQRPLLQGGSAVFLRSAHQETDLTALRVETRSILDSLADLVVLSDSQGRILTVNAAFRQFSGLAEGVLEGRLLAEVLQQISRDDAFCLPDTDMDQPLECPLWAGNGEQSLTLLRMVSIHDLEGVTIGRILVATDVTELKREEARLQQHAKLITLGEMAAGMIHEIRSPLTAIKGFTQMISRDINDPRLLRFTEVMEQSVEAVERIINDYLLASKPGLPELVSRSLPEVTRSLAGACENVTRLHSVCFQCLAEDWGSWLAVDMEQLRQVVLNITQNACEAMRGNADAKVLFLVSQTSTSVRISIKDSGPGIDPASLSKLGTPFFTTKPSGTGLGLSVCYQIIHAHGGHVEVESQLGSGTTFHLLLPLIKAAAIV